MRLLLHSAVVVLFLFGLLFAVGDLFLVRYGAPQWVPLVLAVAIFGAQYWYSPRIIEWLFRIEWDEHAREIPARNLEFLRELCAKRGLKAPRVGFIRNERANAFTYGHVPGNARVVVTTGLLRTLTSEEINAVLAHEAGHIEHWDFVVMTVAALVPTLLFRIYQLTVTRGSNNEGNQNRVPFLAEATFLCYLVSQFLVLMLSRAREYCADRYAARVTRAPNALTSALLKISYGMACAERDAQEGDRQSWGPASDGAAVPALPARRYVGERVTIEGWFRRGTRPYIEMSSFTGEDGQRHRAWSRWSGCSIGWART
jgi:heat shock protein HtpX